MLKRTFILLVAVGFFAATTNSHATRARSASLFGGDGGLILDGSGNSGSFYVDDAYNVFYNPSFVNNNKDWAVIEKSNYSSTGGDTNGGTAMGGIFMSATDMVNLGFYFNRAAAATWFLPSLVTSTGAANTGSFFDTITGNAAFTNSMRPIETFVGFDAGMSKWGLGLMYANSQQTDNGATASNDTGKMWTATLGGQIAGWEPFLMYGTAKTKEASSQVTAEGTRYRVGFRYKWGEWVPMAVFQRTKFEADNLASGASPNAGELETTDTIWGLNIGRNMAAGKDVRFNYSLGYWRQTYHNSVATTGASSSVTRVPLTLGLEADALSWLVLRGGFQFDLRSTTNGKDNTDNAGARVGATAKVGGIGLDWMFGSGDNTATNGVEGTQANSQVLGISESMFTALSLTYAW